MNRFTTILLVFIGFVGLSACSDSQGSSATHNVFPAIANQYTIFPIPLELKEISGIAFKDAHTVLAVEDEDGIIYQYDLIKKAITAKTVFAGKGDYEDLAIVNQDVFVVSSKGALFQVKNFMTGNNVSTVKIQTPLNKENNIEGLAFDRTANRLLLAAKSKGAEVKKNKEIFAYDLKTGQLDTTPVYSIKLKEIEKYFQGDAIEETSKKFLEALGNKNMNEVFRTSAIAVGPSGDLYVLSSVNNLIAVIDRNGALLRVIRLRGKIFNQPEGLAFSPDGKIYVSNEARKRLPNIILLNNDK